MAPERAINAVRTHVPLAVLIGAIGLTATVMLKGGALVKSAVEDEYNFRMPPIYMRLEALEARVDEIKTTQMQVVKELKALEIEQARLSGETRGNWRSAAPGR